MSDIAEVLGYHDQQKEIESLRGKVEQLTADAHGWKGLWGEENKECSRYEAKVEKLLLIKKH